MSISYRENEKGVRGRWPIYIILWRDVIYVYNKILYHDGWVEGGGVELEGYIYTHILAGVVLINNVVRDTHSPFGQAV